MSRKIVHLVDDLTAGGVTRFLEHLAMLPELQAAFEQDYVEIRRGRWSAPVLEADVIVSHLSVSWKNLAMFLALRALNPNTPLIHIEHSYSPSFMEQKARNKTRLETVLRTVYALFDHVVAVSKAQQAWMLDRELVQEARCSAIHPLTDLQPFLRLQPASGVVTNLAVISRLEEEKGVDVLIQAFRMAAPDNIKLSVYGTGSAQRDLVELAGQDPRITFYGQSDPAIAMSEAQIIAVPSRRETFGLVALEGRAAGRTVLVSGADGLDDQVADGAVRIGADLSDWCRAMADLDALHDGDRVRFVRARALEAANRSRLAWTALFQHVAAPALQDLAS
ncbi:MAG: glycosyltransferase [Pseudomonadota bacterium]